MDGGPWWPSCYLARVCAGGVKQLLLPVCMSRKTAIRIQDVLIAGVLWPAKS